MEKLLRGDIKGREILAKLTTEFLLEAGQGDQISRVGDDFAGALLKLG